MQHPYGHVNEHKDAAMHAVAWMGSAAFWGLVRHPYEIVNEHKDAAIRAVAWMGSAAF